MKSEEFLTKLYDIKASREALDFVYTEIIGALMEDDLKFGNEVLSAVDLDRIDTAAILSILTATRHHGLTGYRAFHEKAKSFLAAKYPAEKASSLVYGLEPVTVPGPEFTIILNHYLHRSADNKRKLSDLFEVEGSLVDQWSAGTVIPDLNVQESIKLWLVKYYAAVHAAP